MLGTELITRTGKDIWEALNTFGLHHVRERWLQQNGVKIDACILGGAAYNLGVAPTSDFTNDDAHSLEAQLSKVHITPELQEEFGYPISAHGPLSLTSFITGVNDKRLTRDELDAKFGYQVSDAWDSRDERLFKFDFFEIKEAARRALEPYADTEFTFRAINIDPINVEASFTDADTWEWDGGNGESESW